MFTSTRLLSNLDQEYSDAYLSLITSNMEGFSLALLESLAHGVPVISYDIKYGPNELITPDFNGYLITKMMKMPYLIK